MKSMLLLGLETSGRAGSVALLSADRIDCIELDSKSGSAKTLAPAIDEILRQASVRPSDLTGIAVVHGPGSFTGLRVGVTMAKVMAYALNLPVIAIDSLHALAWAFRQSSAGESTFWTVMDAYRGEVFAAFWKVEPDQKGPCTIIASTIMPVAEWSALATKHASAGSRLRVVGPTASKLSSAFNGLPLTFDGIDAMPRADSVVQLGKIELEKGHFVKPIDLLPSTFEEAQPKRKLPLLRSLLHRSIEYSTRASNVQQHREWDWRSRSISRRVVWCRLPMR